MAFPAEIPPPPPFFYVPASPPFVAAHHPVAHAIPPAMLLNPTDTLRTDVLRQIEYYFSNENLVKDMYLRQKMDEQGWVPVTLIAGFNRVLMLTKHIPNSAAYILDSLRTSELLEVQGDMIRRRGDWANWLPRSQSSHQSSLAAANVDSVVDHMQNVMLGERTSNNSSGGSSDQ
ncbi:la-related protein 1B-like [Asparagus officinalis]|uniref:la-related protein 1B-like n=1 Tax=Asparagus officinalis TaxID=4686 RepID=UPI00098DFEE0|nr:la-related protein 1B-like [Asparagus officinalis]